jgi:hypothetical protein
MAKATALMNRQLFILRHHMIWRFAAFSLFCPPLWAASAEVPCTDIRKIDLANTSIDIGGGVLDFRNGAASVFDDSEPKTLDWTVTFIKDIIVEATPTTPVRFLLINFNHVSGSGSLLYVFGYGCFQGTMKEVFKRRGVSLSIDQMNAHAVVVSLNTVPGSPIRKYFSYIWNDKTSSYELNSTGVKK